MKACTRVVKSEIKKIDARDIAEEESTKSQQFGSEDRGWGMESRDGCGGERQGGSRVSRYVSAMNSK